MKILVTGIAGFVGYHITKLLLQDPTNIKDGIHLFIEWYLRSNDC